MLCCLILLQQSCGYNKHTVCICLLWCLTYIYKDYGNDTVPDDHPHRNRYDAARDWWVTQAELELAERMISRGDARYPIDMQVVVEGRRRTFNASFSHGETLDIDAANIDRRVCAGCHQRFSRALRACSRCLVVYYCSRDCQRADWRAHQPNCRSPVDVMRQR